MAEPAGYMRQMTTPAPVLVSDGELLARYRAGSADAFATLVSRHADWVCSVARRRVGDAHAAEDVTQIVMLAMAAKGRPDGRGSLARWLFATTRHTAANAVRARARRRRHEAAAAAAAAPRPSSDPAWSEVTGVLEAAVARLRRAERQAVLLRFYQQLSHADVAAALGLSEDAARKRVARAVGHLRRHLAARGVTLTSASLSSVLLAYCVAPARAGLAATITTRRPRPAAARTPWRWAAIAAGSTAVIAGVWWRMVHPPSVPAPAVARDLPAPIRPLVHTADPATRAAATPSLGDVIAAIDRTEHQFANVHVVRFETTTETRPTVDADWEPDGSRFAGSAWYGADRDGPQRIYYAAQTLPVEGNDGRTFTQTLDLSSDGRTVLDLSLGGGRRGGFGRARQARLSPVAGQSFLNAQSRFHTGVGYTMQYLASYGFELRPPTPSFAEVLRRLRDAGHVRPQVSLDTMNGSNVVHVGLPSPLTGDFWFDPARGFALVRSRTGLTLPGQSSVRTIDVQVLKPVSPGVWFPLRATLTAEASPGGSTRYTYRADDVVANDPAFDPATLRPAIPVGWRVTDERQQPPARYVVAADGSHLPMEIGQPVPRVPPADDVIPGGADQPAR